MMLSRNGCGWYWLVTRLVEARRTSANLFGDSPLEDRSRIVAKYAHLACEQAERQIRAGLQSGLYADERAVVEYVIEAPDGEELFRGRVASRGTGRVARQDAYGVQRYGRDTKQARLV